MKYIVTLLLFVVLLAVAACSPPPDYEKYEFTWIDSTSQANSQLATELGYEWLTVRCSNYLNTSNSSGIILDTVYWKAEMRGWPIGAGTHRWSQASNFLFDKGDFWHGLDVWKTFCN